MKQLFLDSTVLVLAVGGPHPLRAACQSIIRAIGRRGLTVHASTEAIQELVFHRVRKGDTEAAEDAREFAAMCVLHAFDEEVLERSLTLIEGGPVRGRDAVHAATALVAGFSEIVSADTVFDDVPGLRRVDPSVAAARL